MKKETTEEKKKQKENNANNDNLRLNCAKLGKAEASYLNLLPARPVTKLFR